MTWGYMRDGKMNGRGRIVWSNGYKEGTFVDGNIVGIGKFVFMNGDLYTGTF